MDYIDFWAHSPNVVYLWTFYEKPGDAPNHYIIRRYHCFRDGKIETGPAAGWKTRAEAEACVPSNKTFVPRSPDDQPSILGSWI